MQAQKLPAGRGWLWFKEGLLLLWRNPGAGMFITFSMLLIQLVANLLLTPFIGAALIPFFLLLILNTFRCLDEENTLSPEHVFSGLKKNLPALIGLGGIWMLVMALISMLTAYVDNGASIQLMNTMAEGKQADQMVVDRVMYAFMLTILLVCPASFLLWFAPPLAGWWGIPAHKSLFFSCVASLWNWRVFLAYALSLFLFVSVPLSLLLALTSRLFPALGNLLMLMSILIMIPAGLASYYISVRDIFLSPPKAEDSDTHA